jgi:acyl-CoA thioesterase-1
MPVQHDLAPRRAVESGHQGEQRGLATAGRSQDRDELARGDGEIDAIDDGELPASRGKPPRETAELDARGRRGLVYLTVGACANAASHDPLVIFLGDSLTAGLGLPADEAFPALVEKSLASTGRHVRVVNAGVSGDTTSGGLERVRVLMEQKPGVLVVGLGANDGLRGQPIDRIETNLRAIVKRGKAGGAHVLLLGMRIPTSYGPDYTEAFAALYPRVAKSEGVDLMPFLLEGVAGNPDLNMDDGIHPNREGQRIVADHVRPYVERAMKAKR